MLKMATKCLTQQLDQLRNMSKDAKTMIVDHRQMLPTAGEEERKELQENIKELEKVADIEIEFGSVDKVVLEGFSGIPVGLIVEIHCDSDSDEESSLCDDEDDFDGGSESCPVAFCNSP
ncbi:uncharacterized protein LOC143281586 [Babylonia areolata]|uniref:uncharacterized protein LOC143281586 n=1 Tax=Babylonia areolata TaxID=304850 RepID=UPI003FD59FE5